MILDKKLRAIINQHEGALIMLEEPVLNVSLLFILNCLGNNGIVTKDCQAIGAGHGGPLPKGPQVSLNLLNNEV